MKLQIISRITFALTALTGFSTNQIKADSTPLKYLYEDAFLIGNIMAGGFHAEDPPYREDDRELAILAREYNCLTSENNMKMMFVQPKEGVFNFKGTDAAVDFAESNDMVYVGHALVWHSMVPDWIFKYKNGKEVSREDLINRMRTHIYTLVGRY